MLKYRGRHLIRAGFIGVTLIVLVIAVGLQPQRLLSLATAVRYEALFADAAGLTAGNDVKVSGVKVGSVASVDLRGLDALVRFTVDSTVQLGSETTAHVRTGTLLGQRVLTLESAGPTAMHPLDVIPRSRTSEPYSLTEVVGDVTSNISGTDTGRLNASLNALSATLDRVAPQLGPMFDGLTRLSTSLNNRDAALTALLSETRDVTGIMAQRSDQINTLILNGDELLGVLNDRRRAIVELLANTSAVAQQLSGVVADNKAKLAPTLDKLNSVAAMLEHSRDDIAAALPRLAKYQNTLGETVSNGHYYTAYVPNLAPAEFTQPFLDLLFHLKPRAQFPFPRNGIPQGPHP